MKPVYICLSISIAGIFLLLLISISIKPKPVNSYNELKENLYVSTTGKIIFIKNYGDFSTIKLDNNITITCNCKFPVNSTILAIGRVELYQSNLQINTDKIEYLNN
jgi:hypothetical protein